MAHGFHKRGEAENRLGYYSGEIAYYDATAPTAGQQIAQLRRRFTKHSAALAVQLASRHGRAGATSDRKNYGPHRRSKQDDRPYR